MTATTLSPERLREIAALRDGAIGWFREALTELLAEVTCLRSDLDHATAHDGDHLSKASRRMVDTVMGDRDALRAKVRERDARIAALESELLESSEQHGVYRDRAQLLADRVLADELRIAALETGLREAIEHWRYPQLSHGEKARKDEIWSLVYPIDGVQSQGAT